MRSFKLCAIGIVAILIILAIPGSTAWKDELTGNCWVRSGTPAVEDFIDDFEIPQGDMAYDEHWVLDPRDDHDPYYAYGYYTHYYTPAATEYGKRTQIKRYVPEDYVYDPAFNFGWAGYEYNEQPTMLYEYDYDNGAAWDDNDVMDGFDRESTRQASVKITTGTGADTSLTLGTSGDLNNVRVYIPNTVDETIEDPEAGETYEIDLPGGQQTIDVIISESGDSASIVTPVDDDHWIIVD